MNHNSSQIDCMFVEKIIFQNSINELSEMEKSQILLHINTCENCKSSDKIMHIIKQKFHQELTDNQISPNPAIFESLKNKLKITNKKQNPIVDFFINFFEVKIPLYQVISALLLIGVMVLFLNKKSYNFESFNNNVSIIAAIDSNTISMSFQNSLELIDNQNKGKSIIEDSVLSNFVQSAM